MSACMKQMLMIRLYNLIIAPRTQIHAASLLKTIEVLCTGQ